MRALRSVSGQLITALVVLVLIALATSYLVVVPTLDHQLVSNRLNELERSGVGVSLAVTSGDSFFLQSRVEGSASALDVRVVVFQELGPPLRLAVVADSLRSSSSTVESDPVALAAARSGRIQRGTVSRTGSERAEVAVPVAGTSELVLLSGSLAEAKQSVETVRKQLLVAAIPALLVALLIGILGARRLTSRIRRLERGADRIAAGSLEQPIEDEGEDEVGQLSRSFERMRQRLARLDEARREFIANASHELRTPIFALSGSLELLSEEEMDEANRQEFLETMRGQVERLEKLATALLDLSRLDAGKLDLVLEPLALAAVAEALEQEFAAAAELSEHPLSLAASSESELLVEADEQRTLQIGRILLENAIVHTPRGVPVSIGATREGDRGLLIIEDGGHGIPADCQERVFERFFRLDGEKSSGSGLGLAIGREWARRMNGDLTLESRPGLTRFTLSLPLAKREEEA
ncbi:MAG: HAMP domain-containing sensor histidine kinase [Gaiellaceae bacterium]